MTTPALTRPIPRPFWNQLLGGSVMGRSVLGLGSAALAATTDFDSAGSSAAARSYAIQRSNHTGTQPASTITGLGALATANTVNLSTQATGTLQAGQMPALSGDVTTAGGSFATAIGAGSVTLSKMANISANSILGNNTGSPGTPWALTVAQVNAMLGTPILVNNTVSPVQSLTIISKQKSSSVGLIEVSPADAAAISAGWKPYFTQFTLTLNPSDSSYGGNGVKIYIGMSGNQIQYYTGIGGSSSQVSATGTVQLYNPVPVIPNNGGTGGGTVSVLTGTFLYGPSTALNDFLTPPIADCIIKPSHYTRSALWISRPDVTGLDQGYLFGLGQFNVQGYQFLSDAHTIRRFFSGGLTHFDNALTLNRQGWHTLRWGKHDGYANAVAAIQANLDLTNQSNLTIGQEQVADGVMQFNGGLTNTGPAGLSFPPQTKVIGTGITNNFNPGIGFLQEWTISGATSLSGMVAGVIGEIRNIRVIGTGTLTFLTSDGNSSAANQFSSVVTQIAYPGDRAICVYDSTNSKWQVQVVPASACNLQSGNTWSTAGVQKFSNVSGGSSMSFGDLGSSYFGLTFENATPSFSNAALFGIRGAKGGQVVLQAPAGANGSFTIQKGNDAGGNGSFYFGGSGRFGLNSTLFSSSPAAVLDAMALADGDSVLRLRNRQGQTAPTQVFSGLTSTSAHELQSFIDSQWSSPTNASQLGRIIFGAYDVTAKREGLRIDAATGVAKISFFGGSTVVQQTVAAPASDLPTVITLANSLRDLIRAYSLAA